METIKVFAVASGYWMNPTEITRHYTSSALGYFLSSGQFFSSGGCKEWKL